MGKVSVFCARLGLNRILEHVPRTVFPTPTIDERRFIQVQGVTKGLGCYQILHRI